MTFHMFRRTFLQNPKGFAELRVTVKSPDLSFEDQLLFLPKQVRFVPRNPGKLFGRTSWEFGWDIPAPAVPERFEKTKVLVQFLSLCLECYWRIVVGCALFAGVAKRRVGYRKLYGIALRWRSGCAILSNIRMCWGLQVLPL